MQRSPIFWVAVGMLSVYGYHRFVKPMPGKSASY